MLAIDKADRVVHASSFSKTVSPGVRVGYLAGPAGEIAKLAKRANETYISPNMLAESVVLELCRSGGLDRNIEFVKGALRDRRDALVEALREQIPEAEFVVPGGGYFLWLDLAEGTDTTGAAGRGQGRGRRLRRRPRLHDRRRRQQPPPLLRQRAAGADPRGRRAHRPRAGAGPRRLARLDQRAFAADPPRSAGARVEGVNPPCDPGGSMAVANKASALSPRRQRPGLATQVHRPDRRLDRLAAFLAACGSDERHDDDDHRRRRQRHGGDETEQFGKGDVGILNYALTLEYLETAFYADVVKSGLFKGSDLATIRKFGSEEAEHVAALTAASSRSAASRRRSRRPNSR